MKSKKWVGMAIPILITLILLATSVVGCAFDADIGSLPDTLPDGDLVPVPGGIDDYYVEDGEQVNPNMPRAPPLGKIFDPAGNPFPHRFTDVPSHEYSEIRTIIASGGDYTTLSDAFAAINDATNSKRYLFKVYGLIAEDSQITAENYIDIQGYNAIIEVDDSGGAAFGARVLNITDAVWQDITIIRKGTTSTTLRHALLIDGTTTRGFKTYRVRAINQVTTNSGNSGISVQDTADPYMEDCYGEGSASTSGSGVTIGNGKTRGLYIDCEGLGGGGSNGYGLVVQGGHTAAATTDDQNWPTVIGGRFQGGPDSATSAGYQTSHGGGGYFFSVHFIGGDTSGTTGALFWGENNAHHKACKYEGGKNGGSGIEGDGSAASRIDDPNIIHGGSTNSHALYFQGYCSIQVNGGSSRPRDFLQDWSYDDADNGRFLPFATHPYAVISLSVDVNVTHGGETVDIGTAIGGAQIAANIPLDASGWSNVVVNQVALAGDAYLYATPSAPISDGDVNVMYTVVYNYNTNIGLYLKSGGHVKITDFDFLVNEASNVVDVRDANALNSMNWEIHGGSLDKIDRSANYAIVLASATEDVPIYDTNINGLLSNVSSFDVNPFKLWNGLPADTDSGWQVFSVWVKHDDQSPSFVTLPVNYTIGNISVFVKEAFNSDAADTIEVGYAADHDSVLTSLDVEPTGRLDVTGNYGIECGYMATQRALAVYYTNGGSEPNTGEALVTIEARIFPAP